VPREPAHDRGLGACADTKPGPFLITPGCLCENRGLPYWRGSRRADEDLDEPPLLAGSVPYCPRFVLALRHTAGRSVPSDPSTNRQRGDGSAHAQPGRADSPSHTGAAAEVQREYVAREIPVNARRRVSARLLTEPPLSGHEADRGSGPGRSSRGAGLRGLVWGYRNPPSHHLGPGMVLPGGRGAPRSGRLRRAALGPLRLLESGLVDARRSEAQARPPEGR